MKKIHYTGWVIAAMLAVILFLTRGCEKTVTYHDKVVKTEYVYDTTTRYIKYTDTVHATSIKYLEIPSDVDTGTVLEDYFAERTYARDHVDTNIIISIYDTISKNRINHWAVSYQWKQPKIVNTIHRVEAPKSSVSVGVNLHTNLGFGVGGTFINNKGIIFDASYYLKDKSVNLGARVPLIKY